eukprot:266353_1
MTTEGSITKQAAKIDREQFLKDNKLSDVTDLFVKRDITIEELIEFDVLDLRTFAKDCGLDSLQKSRFIKAMTKLKSQTDNNSTSKLITKPKHIIVSQQEHNSITKLYEKYTQISKQIDKINQCFISLNKSETNCIQNINNYFDELILNVNNYKQNINKQCETKYTQKENILKTQLESLQKYMLLLNIENKKCKEYMNNTTIDSKYRKKQILLLVNNT